MSHRSKKWIRDYKGRLKRSRNRTYIDKQGELIRFDRVGNIKKCSACVAKNAPYVAQNKLARKEFNRRMEQYLGSNPDNWNVRPNAYSEAHRKMKIPFTHLPYDQQECSVCAEKTKNKNKFWKYIHKYGPRADDKQSDAQRIRSANKKILRRAKYEDLDLCDTFVGRKRVYWD